MYILIKVVGGLALTICIGNISGLFIPRQINNMVVITIFICALNWKTLFLLKQQGNIFKILFIGTVVNSNTPYHFGILCIVNVALGFSRWNRIIYCSIVDCNFNNSTISTQLSIGKKSRKECTSYYVSYHHIFLYCDSAISPRS